MSVQALRLEIADFIDANHWRWTLTDANGAFLADHAVALDPKEPKYQALFDLPAFLRHYSAPDNRDADERRLLRDVGAWIGEIVLGRGICEKILAQGLPPIIVRVVVPQTAERLLVFPLEIGHAGGKPLALQGVSLLFEIPGAAPAAAAPIGDRLRLLALFSLPPAGSPLNLRRERQMLRALVRRLTGAARLAIELRVLQYGVTRASLLHALEEGEGWDVIHFSGHGLPGSLVLESPDGTPDLIPSVEVAELLRQGGKKLKLVVLSACLSAAASIQQTLAWLGEAPQMHQKPAAASTPAAAALEAFEAAPTVARALVRTLDCAVLAMRYAVEDEFAIALAGAVYDRLFLQRQSLPRATQRALSAAVGDDGSAAGALSMVTPALFGAKAAELELVPPRGPAAHFVVEETGLAHFPREPEHFVGRVNAMTRASAALAADSEKSGILFHGMAGAGKTSCAVELAYHHQAAARFQAFVWYSAPEPDKDIALALRDFALAMEKQLPGFKMVHVVDRVETFKDWLPHLTEMLESNGVLIVLDNLESLLTEFERWRDERWGLLIDALLRPGGLSRAVLTSRIRPAGLPVSTELIAVHALPLDEALLLVRELPNLRRLLDGTAPGTSLVVGRELVRRTLRLVQGHPKLIQLAENLAADPERLAGQLERADAEQGSGELDAFFREGETHFDAAAFTASLRNWTNGIAGALPEAARTFFHFLCAIEEGDRDSWVIDANWADLLKRIGGPEQAPGIAELLTPLLTAGLVEKKTLGADGKAFEVMIHPGVAEAARTQAGLAFQQAVDVELSATWHVVMQRALDKYGSAPGRGTEIVRAGLSAFPYLNRRQEWEMASWMLEQVVGVDVSPATVAAVLPRMRRVAGATTGTTGGLGDRRLLGRVLRIAGRAGEAEPLMRAVIAQAADRGEFDIASGAAGELAALLEESGRVGEALSIVEQKVKYSRCAGFGPWTRLSDEARRLQILASRGEHESVLQRVIELRSQMEALPTSDIWSEPVPIWSACELVLGVGRESASALAEWQQALDLNREILRSKQARGVPQLDWARARFNDYYPLARLHRYKEAGDLLVACRSVFEHENDLESLAAVLGALGSLESDRGRPAEARHFESTALRYEYMIGKPGPVAVSHFNLANHIVRGGGEWGEVLAHRLAAVFITVLTQSGDAVRYLAQLGLDCQRAGPQGRAALPTDFVVLCAIVERIEGVRFHEMMERVMAGKIAGDQLLQAVLAGIEPRLDRGAEIG
jgi:tetratricopeptide (TPR) repeat protein